MVVTFVWKEKAVTVTQLVWVRREVLRARPLSIIQRIVGMEYGCVFMVVDHIPTDDPFASGPGPFASACAQPRLRLRLLRHHHTAGRGRRPVKDSRRGRELGDRREVASEEIRGRDGTLLRGKLLRILKVIRFVWMKF